MKETNHHSEPSFPMPELTPLPSPPVHLPDSPDSILKDLMNAERDIAEESLRMAKVRNERDREQWQRILAAREQELLTSRSKIAELEETIKRLQIYIREEEAKNIEHVKENARDIEERTRQERQKWDSVADQVRAFRTTAEQLQQKLLSEQEKMRHISTTFHAREESLKAEIAQSQDQLLEAQEQCARAQEVWLKEKAELRDTLEQRVSALARIEKLHHETVDNATKDALHRAEELAKLQGAVSKVVIQLNDERVAYKELFERSLMQEKKIQVLEAEREKMMKLAEHDRAMWLGLVNEERAKWEQYRTELSEKESVLRAEAEKGIQQIIELINKTGTPRQP